MQTPETMKLIGSTKKITDKRKNGENTSILKVVEVFLIQRSLADNQYQQKSEVLYTLRLINLILIC